MKKMALTLAMGMILMLSATAQFPGTGGKPGQQPPAMGRISGKITDTSGAALNEVSVLILQKKFDTVTKKSKEVLLSGVTTKNNGEFTFGDLPIFGQLKLKISATGFKPVEQTVTFQMKMNGGSAPKPNGNDPSQAMAAISSMAGAFDKDLGNIKLEVDTKQLQNLTVVSSKPAMTLDIDKKVFAVDKNLVSAGGTALDVMRNVPSVQVDIDGNVTLRNAAPQSLHVHRRIRSSSLRWGMPDAARRSAAGLK